MCYYEYIRKSLAYMIVSNFSLSSSSIFTNDDLHFFWLAYQSEEKANKCSNEKERERARINKCSVLLICMLILHSQ